jgi:hypothetical protein
LATWYRLDENFPKTFGLYILKIVAHTMLACQSLVSPIAYLFSNSFETRNNDNVMKHKQIVNASVTVKLRSKTDTPVFV